MKLALFLAKTLHLFFGLPSWKTLSSQFPLPSTSHSLKQFAFFVSSVKWPDMDRSTKSSDRISGGTILLLTEKMNQINTKTIENRKRDCAWGCAGGINTTWENLQVEKHKSGRRSLSSPDWFVLFDLQIFSGGVYPPSATSRTISFSISNSFWY